jgi:3-deoxy-D-manno-octulosonic acid kinase
MFEQPHGFSGLTLGGGDRIICQSFPPPARVAAYCYGPMNLKFEQTAGQAIVYDADCIQQPAKELFDPAYWQQRGAVRRVAAGRGNTLILDTAFGLLVLRAYLRGGWAARCSRERYLFTGFDRSRPVLEMRILAELTRLGLPVPQPVAGLCSKHGPTYTAALLTRCISPAQPLAELLDSDRVALPDWVRIGRCIRRFHAAGVVHPDLNVRNILLGPRTDSRSDVYLVDFDRARLRNGAARVQRAGLQRLRRSLQKAWPDHRQGDLQACWAGLLQGYNGQG